MDGAQQKQSKAEEVKEDPPKLLKILTTCVIFYSNISYACAINSFSPSLTDFKVKYETDTSTISVVFTAAVGCYMVGALLSGFLYEFLNRQFTIVLLFIGISGAMIGMPHIPTLTGLYFMGGLIGLCIGAYDTAQIVWMMEMWQSESGPYIQAQHFFYALGTVLAPVIIGPFLENKYGDDSTGEKNDRLFVPFTIIGTLCGVAALGHLLLFIFMRYKPPLRGAEPEAEEKFFSWPGWPAARLIILSALSLGFYQGMEMLTLNLFPTFGQKSDLQLSEHEAADTLAGLTAAFAFGRGAAILLILKIPAQFILVANILLIMAGNVVVFWGRSEIKMLWAAAILYGLGFSSFMPSFYAFTERYLVFTNAIGAMMVVTGSVVGALYPLIVGSFIDENPIVMSYPIFLSLGVLICTVSLSYGLTRKLTKRINE